MEVTVNDLRSRTKKLLDRVVKGEELVITYHGKPCAKLVPFTETGETAGGPELYRNWRENVDIKSMLVSMAEG